MKDLNILFLSIMGSHAYGTNTENSDTDLRGVAIPKDAKYFFGLSNFEQYEDPNDDTVIFSLKKFLQLAMTNNPNILEILFQNDERLIKTISPIWKEHIVKNRQMFLSKQCHKSYVGYSHAQVKRMENHRQWVVNPPVKPDPENFFLKPDDRYERYKEIFIDYDKSIEGLENRVKYFIDALSEEERKNILYIRAFYSKIIVKYRHRIIEKQGYIFDEESYDAASKEHQKYLDWIANRNKIRSELEMKHGYDTKHASHCIRLLDQVEDIFLLKDLRVCRPDRVQLWKDIRAGKFSYDEFSQMYKEKLTNIDELCKISDLPDRVDFNKVEQLCINIHNEN